MKTYGLVGYPLSHSFSEKYFSEKFKKENITNCQYKLFPLKDITGLHQLIASEPALCGLNVTIPHKVSVIDFLDNKESLAGIGAVNTIKITRADNKIILTGYNTDAHAFFESIKSFIKPHFKSALIIGTGGAARAAAFSLNHEPGIKKITFVSRKPQHASHISYGELKDKTKFSQYDIIVNTTPLGMSPNVNECPAIPYDFITEKQLVFDMIYNPPETLFLQKAIEQGAQTKNGLDMFYLQAEKSWAIWNSPV